MRAIAPVSVDERQMRLAGDALERFGRGRHPARLNFGDCFSYALARALDEPLLFKGEDFGAHGHRPGAGAMTPPLLSIQHVAKHYGADQGAARMSASTSMPARCWHCSATTAPASRR